MLDFSIFHSLGFFAVGVIWLGHMLGRWREDLGRWRATQEPLERLALGVVWALTLWLLLAFGSSVFGVLAKILGPLF